MFSLEVFAIQVISGYFQNKNCNTDRMCILFKHLRIIINTVDKFKKKKAAHSPDINIRTSTRINKRPIK